MKEFCKKFWSNYLGGDTHEVKSCPQCLAAWQEAEREMAAIAEIDGPVFERSNPALDCHGQP